MSNGMEFKDYRLEIKAEGDDGTFSGYASTFGNTDHVDDVVDTKAFDRYLTEKVAKGIMPKMLWQHDSRSPIGVFTDVRKDMHGLIVRGKLALKTSKGAEAYELLKMGAIDAMSIGFYLMDYDIDRQKDVRILKEIDLFEVSLVTFPANEAAKIAAVKNNGLPRTKREFEKFLREAGYSRDEARNIASTGYDDVKGGHREDGSEALINSISTLTHRLKESLK